MTAETRRRVFQYGIAIDLVILATGVGFLYSAAALLIIISYIGAVGLTAWKCGWRPAAVAILLSTVLMVTLFSAAITPMAVAAFIAASVVTTAIVRTAIPAPRVQAEAASQPIGDVVAFELRIDQEQRAREAEVRQQMAQALERAADEQLERQREVAEPAPAIVEAPPPEILEAPPAPPEPVVVVQEEPVPPPSIEPPPPIESPVVEAVEGRVAEHRRRLRSEANLKIAREVKRIRREMEEEFEQQLAGERGGIEAEFAEHLRREREAAETALRERLERERATLQADLERRLAAERDEVRAQTDRLFAEQLAPEREALRAAAEERLQRERDELRRAIDERLLQAIQQETRAIDETLQKRIDEERAAIRRRADEQVVAARLSAQKEVAAGRPATAPSPLPKAEAPPRAPAPLPLRKPPVKSDSGSGMFATITGWLARPRRKTVNDSARKTVGTAPVPRRPVAAPVTAPAARAVRSERKPRLLLVERRRGEADAIAPKIKQRGVEVEIVERWVDAVDEIFRFRPDALLVDTELPDFNKIYTTIVSQRPNLPIFVTGQISPGTTSSVDVKHAGFVARPYDADALAQIARQAMAEPQHLAGKIASRPPSPAPVPPPVPIQAKTAPAPAPVIAPVPIPAPAPVFVEPTEAPPMTAPPLALTTEALPAGDSYNVVCYNCRTPFDAMASDWCSCLTRERTLVCANCLVCFCKAPPSYKEKFWMEAPPQLYDRKPSQLRKRDGVLAANVAVGSVTRPLVLCVEDDEEIQHIVQRVCLNLGYGFVHAENGLDGLEAARLYEPNLILSEAFMPRLDGREMGRMYKEETATDCAVIIMTGLYTDTKYRSEALKRFHVDEYLAKPVSVTDLVHLLQKYLEGTTAVARQMEPPPPEPIRVRDDEDSIELGDLLEQVDAQVVETRKNDSYEICCHNCNRMFDAVQAEWCTCFGRDQTLLCTHCGICFCQAPSVYKERFWIDAPPSLFERKMLGSKRNTGGRLNPTKDEVTRPLILLVEADENIQLIVRTVVTTMGYGFILGANGQEGLALARDYNPELILSDAFMPKLDGREMCRLLKEDPTTARVKAIIMTGLYTDRKYRNEALDYFKIDDYVAKPVAVDDLIKLFRKHLPQEMQPTM